LSGATIAAIATGPAPGGVGILRISGPRALEVSLPLLRGVPPEPEPRRAYFCTLTDRAGEPLDRGLVLYFRAPASFTGEDVVELQAHGGPRLLQLLLREVLADPGTRLAQAGEFTRRAYVNGRLDLARAEAVAALVSAESERAVRAAAGQLVDGLGGRLAELQIPLLALLTDLEGVLNFPDEAEGADDRWAERLEPLVALAQRLSQDVERGALLRRGAKVALFGPVNAGKSTLFNRLSGAPRALVDDEPGTTRDVLEARVEVDGLGWTLLDTAGLREGPGRLEALGMARAQAAVACADLAVLLLPPGAREDQVAEWRAWAGPVRVLEVTGKADLRGEVRPARELAVSGTTGEGVDTLARAITSALWNVGAPGAVALMSEHHADAVRRAVTALERAREAAAVSTLEVVAGELGLALDALADVSGERAAPAVLDALFVRFCIGK
jgi:tRNA modification GTPase